MKLRNKKTGKFGEYKVISAGFLIRVKDCNSDESWQYDCLAGFIEDWEDYKPTEPLIKDEKARKAVRAWADMQRSCWIIKETDQCCRDSLGYFFNSSKEIFGNLELGIEYTITELCGGEEEPEDDDDEEDLRAEEY